MKKLINVLSVALFVVFAGYNVYKSQKVEVMSDIVKANVEALAESELLPGEYDIIEEKTVFAVDDVPYKETKVVRCEWGGLYACQEGKYWRHKINGIWTDWFYG